MVDFERSTTQMLIGLPELSNSGSLPGKAGGFPIYLIASIKKNGLGEPLLLSEDNYIVSGHRRFYALTHLGYSVIPCRRLLVSRACHPDWHRLLADYNPQRIKGVDAILKETIMNESAEDTARLIMLHREEAQNRIIRCEPMQVDSFKEAGRISQSRRPFLAAVQEAVMRLRPYWPLSVRQIHYQLLNVKPLVNTPKCGTGDPERHLYRNDKKSYRALDILCRDARYSGELPMMAIDDATRVTKTHIGYTDVGDFVTRELKSFLYGYHLHLSASQPVHVEVFAEKNTLIGILDPVCAKYYVNLTPGRGFGSVPTWRDMEARWRASGKAKMIVLIVSDFDPEGLELADDALRSLRDLHNIDVEAIRIAVTAEQIENFELEQNPAKETSSRYKKFVQRTGSTATYECEALDPEELQNALESVITSVFDMDLFNAEIRQYNRDVERINLVRRKVVTGL